MFIEISGRIGGTKSKFYFDIDDIKIIQYDDRTNDYNIYIDGECIKGVSKEDMVTIFAYKRGIERERKINEILK